MFGQLAYEQHKVQSTSDHNRIIVEATSNVITADDNISEDISLEELDSVMADDANAVTTAELDDLEAKIGEIADAQAATGDITTMTKEEIKHHIGDSVSSLTVSELNK